MEEIKIPIDGIRRVRTLGILPFQLLNIIAAYCPLLHCEHTVHHRELRHAALCNNPLRLTTAVDCCGLIAPFLEIVAGLMPIWYYVSEDILRTHPHWNCCSSLEKTSFPMDHLFTASPSQAETPNGPYTKDHHEYDGTNWRRLFYPEV